MNMWGDAAIGMTGMDFETAARNQIPILSILFNNFSMAMEFKAMAVSRGNTTRTDISGNYADLAKAPGGYAARHRCRTDHPCSEARDRRDQGRQARTAGVHHDDSG